MEINQRLEYLQGLTFDNGAQLHETINADSDLKNSIRMLARHYFGEDVAGCSNCFTDAFLRLKNFKPMKDNPFVMDRNCVLYDVINQDSSLVMSANNCTPLLAAYHLLSGNKKCFVYLTKPEPKELKALVKELQEKYPGGYKQVLALLKGETPVEEIPTEEINLNDNPKAETTTTEETTGHDETVVNAGEDKGGEDGAEVETTIHAEEIQAPAEEVKTTTDVVEEPAGQDNAEEATAEVTSLNAAQKKLVTDATKALKAGTDEATLKSQLLEAGHDETVVNVIIELAKSKVK